MLTRLFYSGMTNGDLRKKWKPRLRYKSVPMPNSLIEGQTRVKACSALNATFFANPKFCICDSPPAAITAVQANSFCARNELVLSAPKL